MTCKKRTWTSFANEPLADAGFLTERPDIVRVDESTIDRATRDNPDYPRPFVADTLQALADSRRENHVFCLAR